MILNELLKDLAVKEVRGKTDIEVSNIAFDSRLVKPGTLFVAQRGTAVDGHEYIGKAVEAGAVAIVMEDGRWKRDDVTCIVVENSSHALGLIASAWNG